MKNIYIILILFLSTVFAQVSISDINKLSNQQLDAIKAELQKSDNIPPTEVSKVDTESIKASEILIARNDSFPESNYFGYNYFDKDISFFDNIPTPSGFRLGPGDEIILSLWGETNFRKKFTINKEGLIYFENVGFINLSNNTLTEAELRLTNELSSVYSTLNNQDNPTQLKIELGKLKSVNIYFTGQIKNPGINLIHPFSDIFSAIVQAGGIKNDGSLREIELIRDSQVIKKFDFYSFFIEGKDIFSDIRVLDGDVVHIPTIKNRIEIFGAVYTTGFFEFLANESMDNIIKYAGGLKASSSSSALVDIIFPIGQRISDDNARKSKNLKISDMVNFYPNNGDRVTFLTIGEQETKATVRGRVKSQGLFASGESLKAILDLAGGFDDPVFRQSILEDEISILRKNNEELYASEFIISYDESDTFKVLPNDQIFVYENIFYEQLLTIEIKGEVLKPGPIQIFENMTVGDAIKKAGGFSSKANIEGITIKKSFKKSDDDGNIISIESSVNDASLETLVTPNSIISILPIEDIVNVTGNVYNEGLVVFRGGLSVKKYIERSGGLKPDSIKKSIYIQRANGKIKRTGYNSFA